MSASTPNLLAQPGNPICVSTGVITRRKTDNGRYYNQYYSPNGQPAIGGTHTKVFKAQIGGPDGQTTVVRTSQIPAACSLTAFFSVLSEFRDSSRLTNTATWRNHRPVQE